MPYGQRDRNPDLVENVSTADVEVLGRQRTLTEPKGKTGRVIPPRCGDEYAQIKRKIRTR